MEEIPVGSIWKLNESDVEYVVMSRISTHDGTNLKLVVYRKKGALATYSCRDTEFLKKFVNISKGE